MHAGIAITMQLWLFSLMMIAFNLAAFGWAQRAPRAATASLPGAASPVLEPVVGR
jgi:hypothetical protein